MPRLGSWLHGLSREGGERAVNKALEDAVAADDLLPHHRHHLRREGGREWHRARCRYNIAPPPYEAAD